MVLCVMRLSCKSYTCVLKVYLNKLFIEGQRMKQTQTAAVFLFLLLILFFSSLQTFAAQLHGVDLRVGGDAFVRGFSTTTNANLKDQGYSQLIRLKLDLETEDKIKVKTRTVLSGDRWKGDDVNNAVTGNNSSRGGNNVRLDYGFIEVPLPGNVIARAGRQEANFSDCFNTCDSRRDRLLLLKFMGNYVPALVYDKRVEGFSTNNKPIGSYTSADITGTEKADADMYAAALFHLHKTHEWALLYATWFNDDESYVLNKVHNFSPYYKYKGENFKALLVYNWLGQGAATTGTTAVTKQFYPDHHHSFAIKGEYRLSDRWEISSQFIMALDGGLITNGYDTYSFVVNSDPDNNRSNTRLITMGGLGSLSGGDNADEHFIVGRVRYFLDSFTFSAVVGKAREYVGADQDMMVYDLQAHYQYSKSLKFKTGLAFVRGDRDQEATLFQMETSF